MAGDRSQSFEQDANNPTNRLLMRMLFVAAIGELIFGVVIVLAFGLPWIALAGFAIGAIITAVIVPRGLKSLPSTITIDAKGLTVPARSNQTIFVPWSDIESIEIAHRVPQASQWMYDLLRVETTGEFVRLGVLTDSETRRQNPYLKDFSFYFKEPARFVNAADEFRSPDA